MNNTTINNIYSGVNELVELPDSESGFFGGSNPSARVKSGKGYGNWECCCCKKIFETRKLLLDHKRSSIKCHQFSLEEGRKKTNAAVKGRKYPGRKLTDEHKQKIREAAKNRASYWFYNSKNPIIYKRKDGKEIKLDSKWELETVKRLDKLNIDWYRPKTTFEYKTNDGITHTYHPDFFIPQYKCFLEIKSPYFMDLQNKNGKIDFLKKNFPFIIWLDSLDKCKSFNLVKMNYDKIPDEEAENLELIEKLKHANIKNEKKKHANGFLIRSINLKNERWKLLQECNIDFTKLGWVKEASKLFGIKNENKAGIYIKENFPDFYKNCYKRN